MIQQISVAILVIGFIATGLVLYAAYKVAEKKDSEALLNK